MNRDIILTWTKAILTICTQQSLILYYQSHCVKLLKEARVIQTCVQFDDKTTNQSSKLKQEKKKRKTLKKFLGSVSFNLKIFKTLRHHRLN